MPGMMRIMPGMMRIIEEEAARANKIAEELAAARTIKLSYVPSLPLLRDIVITAVEGGIGYWAACQKYEINEVTRQGYVIGSPNGAINVPTLWKERDWPIVILGPAEEPDEFAVTTVTPELVCKGLQLALERPAFVANGRAGRITQSLLENDASNIDSEDADCIMQLAILGDIVYG